MDKKIIEQAEFCAKLSTMVYTDEAKVRSRFLSNVEDINNFVFISKEGTEVACFSQRGNKYIVFRGTEPNQFSDIKADLKAYKRRSETKGRVHAGFKDALDLVWNNVESWLKKFPTQGHTYVCGHSLGGGLATLAGSRIKHSIVYTFGSPRVGSWSWCKAQTFEHHRFVNNNDIVPKVPFFLLGYKHYGNIHYINHYGNIRKSTYWQRVKDQWRGRYRALQKKQWFDGIFDHNINLYHSKIENVLRSTS